MTILYIFLGSLTALLLISYVLWRVSRYVSKYRAAKKQMDNYREQIYELQQTQTQTKGQSLKDKMMGINFNLNPLEESIE